MHRETNPQPIVSEDGTVATPVGGIYQLDSVLVRLIWPMTWGLRASGAVAWKQNVTW